jgi:outer membrane protein assembly factor BamB/precorrin-6B methylase 2
MSFDSPCAHRARLLIVALVLSFAAAECARADDWPMYGRDATRNPVSPEKNPPTDWQIETKDEAGKVSAPAKNVKWQAALGNNMIGSPIISGGLVWVCTNNEVPRDPKFKDDASCLMCFNESDGAFRWQHLTPRHPGGRVHDWPGSAVGSPPLVEGDRLWFITNRWEVVCLDTGPLLKGSGEPREVWKLDMQRELGVFGKSQGMALNPRCAIGASSKGKIYVITGNGVDETHKRVPAPKAPALICLDKTTGQLVWKDNSPGDNILDTQCSSPLVTEINGRGLVIAPQGDGWLRAFDALTGAPVWQFDANSKNSIFPQTRNELMAPPVLYEGRIYLTMGQSMEHSAGFAVLWCIDPGKAGDVSAELEDGPGTVAEPGGNRIKARLGKPNPNSAVIWKYDQTRGANGKVADKDRMHRCAGSAAVADGLAIVADAYGYIHCFDARTGKRFWTYDGESPAFGSPLICDGKVYVCTENGMVHILALAQEEKVLGQRDAEHTIRSSPVFANGVLYIATRETLYAISEGAVPAAGASSRPSTAALADWPQWRGPERTNIAKDTGLLAEWPKDGPLLMWKVEGLGEGVPSVAVAGGRVFTLGYRDGSDGQAEYLTAWATANGKLLWRSRVGPAVPEQKNMRWLSQRTPTVDDDRVYAVTARGEIVCFSTADGMERWRKDYKADFGGKQNGWGYCDYPLVDGNRLICSPGGKDASVVALDKTTGELLWKCAVPGYERSTYSAAVVAEIDGVRQYIQQFDGGVFGVGTDGALLWHSNAIRLRALVGNVHTALVRDNEVFLSAGWGTGQGLIRLKRQGEKFSVDEIYRDTAMSFGSWIGNSSRLGDFIYTNNGQCIEWKTGKLAWRSDQFKSRVSMVVAEDRLYFRLGDGTVVLAEANPQKYVERGRFKTFQTSSEPTWTSPVIAGGRLYLRDQDQLLCYDIRQDRHGPLEPVPATLPSVASSASRPATRPAGEHRGIDAVFVPTPQDVVEKMLELAEVTKDDVVCDLGCGDGRIIVTAAKKYGSRGVGVDLDPDCVRLSRDAARREGVADRVEVAQKDIFTVDLSKTTVVTLYLGRDVNRRLLPQLRQLPKGARVVSHIFDIEGCKPDKVVEFMSAEDGAKHTLYLWTTPLPEPTKQ